MRSDGIGEQQVSWLKSDLTDWVLTMLTLEIAQGYPKARERLEDLKKGGRMQRTRLSRSTVNRQNEGDCVVM